jgi:hypothetical protein
MPQEVLRLLPPRSRLRHENVHLQKLPEHGIKDVQANREGKQCSQRAFERICPPCKSREPRRKNTSASSIRPAPRPVEEL